MTITPAASDAQNDAAGANDGVAGVTLSGTEGNLQVVYTTHRSSTRTPTIDGTGWSTPVLVESEIGNASARRAIAMWWRVVPAAAGTAVTAGWTTDPGGVVTFGYEHTTDTAGGTWSFDGSNNASNGTTAGTSLASGSVTPANNEAVAIDGLVFRNGDITTEDSYSDTFTAGAGTNEGTGTNALSGTSGTKIVNITPAAMSTTASWTTSTLATSLIGAWSVSTGGGSTQTLTGTLTSAGAPVKDITTAKTGTVTPTGAVAKAVTAPGLAGTVTPTGTAAKLADKPLAGTLATAGTITNIKVVLLALAGTLTTAGSLLRQTQKTTGGTVTPAGTQTRTVTRLLAGLLATVGTAAKVAIKLFTGTGTPAGTVDAVKFGAVTVAGHKVTVPAGSHAVTAVTAVTTVTVPGSHSVAVTEDSHQVTVPAGSHNTEAK